MKAILKMAWRNVVKNWRHSLAAMLSIAAGFVALGLFSGYMTDLDRQNADGYASRAMLGDLVVEKKGAQVKGREEPWRYMLNPAEQAFLEEFLAGEGAAVAARVRSLYVTGLISNGKTSAVVVGFGFDVPEGAIVRAPNWDWNAVAGKPLQAAGPNSVMVGKGLGLALDCEVPPGSRGKKGEERPLVCRRNRIQLSATTEAGQLNAVEPELVGLVDAGLRDIDSRYAIMPLALAQQLLDTHSVSVVAVKLKDPSSARAFAARLSAAAAAHHVDLDVTRWQDHRHGQLYRQVTSIMGVFRSFVTTVVLAVGLLSVLNTLLKSVAERTREIGTLRSIGFLRRQIVILFAVEGGLLALLSCAVGLIATLVVSWSVNHAHVMYKAGMLSEPIQLIIAPVPVTYLVSTLTLVAISVAAAWWPARRAARMKIPDAMGHA